MNDAADRLTLDLSRLDPEGERLEGEIDCLDLDEEFVHPFGGVRYRLTAQLFATELLVRGALEQDFTLVCSRCGRDFDTTIKVADFTESFEIGETTTEIDLSDSLREAVLLELPNYPLCAETCPGIELNQKPPADDRWAALDQLKKD